MVKYKLALELTQRVSDRLALTPQIKIGNVKSRNLHNELQPSSARSRTYKISKKIEDNLGINEEACVSLHRS